MRNSSNRPIVPYIPRTGIPLIEIHIEMSSGSETDQGYVFLSDALSDIISVATSEYTSCEEHHCDFDDLADDMPIEDMGSPSPGANANLSFVTNAAKSLKGPLRRSIFLLQEFYTKLISIYPTEMFCSALFGGAVLLCTLMEGGAKLVSDTISMSYLDRQMLDRGRVWRSV
uniref:Uncharacterized protein n=1 Tax=Spongospora subterranea TaxID=70186 RepID=A0A0H5RCS3_9EUKA|eukprot:CRZ11556.1 hypothetical protein [Spongospora subterranea]